MPMPIDFPFSFEPVVKFVTGTQVVVQMQKVRSFRDHPMALSLARHGAAVRNRVDLDWVLDLGGCLWGRAHIAPIRPTRGDVTLASSSA